MLLEFWIALLGADRIDLLGGRGPAVLLPVHLLTALIVIREWTRRARARSIPRLDARGATFAALLLGALALVALSVLRSADIATSTGRAVLFAATALAVPVALLGMSDRPDLRQILGRGGVLGLAIALLFSGLQVMAFFGLLPFVLEVGPARVLLEPFIYETVPRLAGASADMNRGALMALCHTTFVVIGTPPGRARQFWIAVGAVLIVGSLSRSVGLAAVVALVVNAPAMYARLRHARTARGAAVGTAALLGAVAVVSALLLAPTVRESTGRVLAPLSQRFELTEGSAQAHTYLLRRGLEVASQDVPTTLIGIGFGSAFRALADDFEGGRYGNFHSTWITFWAESGVFALLIVIALFVGPLPRAGPLAGLLLGLMVYNTFYNGHLEPVLWLTFALAWLAPAALRSDAVVKPRPRVPA